MDVKSWDQFGPDYDQPPFSGKPRTYVVAASPRSGSNLLGHLLMSTKVLGSPFEYFHPVHARTWMPLLGVSDFQSMIEGIQARRTSPTGWFGVKSHWFQFRRLLANEPLMRFLAIERYIEIRRRDRLAQAISWVMARQTNAWISFQDRETQPQYDFAAIQSAVAAVQTEVEGWDRFFTQRKIPRLVIHYEDLVERPRGIMKQLLQRFDLQGADIAPGSRFPKRQASEINAEWRERFLKDLAERAPVERSIAPTPATPA